MAQTPDVAKRTAEDVHKLYLDAKRAAVKAEKAAAAHVEAIEALSVEELRKLARLRGFALGRHNRTKAALVASLTAPASSTSAAA